MLEEKSLNNGIDCLIVRKMNLLSQLRLNYINLEQIMETIVYRITSYHVSQTCKQKFSRLPTSVREITMN